MLLGLMLGALFVSPFVFAYLFVVRWSDRFEPQPLWLVMVAFIWGAVFATIFGGTSSAIAEKAFITRTGFDPEGPMVEAFGATVLAPIFEEGFKGIGVVLVCAVSAFALKRFHSALGGVIFGGVVGLGFTLTEDTLYVSKELMRSGFGGFVVLLFLRTVLLGLSHCTFTACTGLGFGIAAEAKSPVVKVAAPIVGFVSAMVMHAIHNALPTLFGGGGLLLMLLTVWAIDLLFFLLIWILVVRDRSLVIRELLGEVGTLLHASELKLVTSYVALGYRNLVVLAQQGWRAYRLRQKKHSALLELAFVKGRRKQGKVGREVDEREASLRAEIASLNREGAWLGRA